MKRQPSELLRSAMDDQAVAQASAFKAQDVSNYLWGMATLGLEPTSDMWRRLQAQVEMVWDSFITQHLANTLWAIAQMGIDKQVRVLALAV
jgi:hypothetical protein